MIKVKNSANLKSFLKSFDKRQKEFKKLIMKDVANAALAEIKAKAPKDLGNNYADHLKAVSVDNESSAVLYFGNDESNVNNVDGNLTLLYLKDIKTSKPIAVDLFEILKSYEPFTMKSFPSAVPFNDFIFEYKKAPKKTITTLFHQNKRDSVDLARDLKELSISLDPSQYEMDENGKSFSELTFQVLQHEMSLKNASKPHWKPALNIIQRKGILSFLKRNDVIVKTIFDPDYNIKDSSSKMSLNVESQSVQSTKEFMQYLRNNE
jgi:hypothetical protein